MNILDNYYIYYVYTPPCTTSYDYCFDSMRDDNTVTESQPKSVSLEVGY